MSGHTPLPRHHWAYTIVVRSWKLVPHSFHGMCFVPGCTRIVCQCETTSKFALCSPKSLKAVLGGRWTPCPGQPYHSSPTLSAHSPARPSHHPNLLQTRRRAGLPLQLVLRQPRCRRCPAPPARRRDDAKQMGVTPCVVRFVHPRPHSDEPYLLKLSGRARVCLANNREPTLARR